MEHQDRFGLTVATVRKSLPARTADFPPAEIVRHKQALRTYRLMFTRCQVCGVVLGQWDVRAEVHHIIGGPGRSDEFPNLILLCNGATGCHTKAHGFGISLAHILWAKWKTNHNFTDWRRLAILKRQFLPEPKEYRVCGGKPSGESGR